RSLMLGISAPFFIPAAITATSWASHANPSNGILSEVVAHLGIGLNIYSLKGIIFVHVVYVLPLVYLVAVATFSNIDSSLEEAGLIHGGTQRTDVLRISTPLVSIAVIGMAALVFLRVIASFEIPYILGTPSNIEV